MAASVEVAIRSRLAAISGVTDLVSTRIYPIVAPQNASVPFITYQRVSSVRHYHLTGTGNLGEFTIQIDAWDDGPTGYADAHDVADAVRNAIETYRARVTVNSVNYDIRRIYLDAENDEFVAPDDQSEYGRHRVRQDYLVWVVETTPTLS